MLNSLRTVLQNYICDNNEQCVLKYVIQANEGLKKNLSVLEDKYKNVSLICKLVNKTDSTVYINPSENHNDIICIKPTFDGNLITKVDLHGYFGVTSLKPQGEKQSIYTEIKFDKDNILYCHIIDFLCFGSRGYGTAMMKVLKDYIQNFSIAYINGYISPVDTNDNRDLEHNERLHHFYKKMGFYFYRAGGDEHIKIDMKEKEICSKNYLDHSVYQLENSCYKDNIYRLLFKGTIKMYDLNRPLRLSSEICYP